MSRFQAGLADHLAGPGPYRLELGAGENGKLGWLATDLVEQQNAKGIYTSSLDVTKNFPIADGVFDYLYCEHMIEHISFEDGLNMLKECGRVLKPGGVLRIVTPSLGFLFRIMSSDRNQLEQNYLDWSVRTFVPNAPIVTNSFFLNNFVRAWGHVFIYDHSTLVYSLKSVGFRDIVECRIGSSAHTLLCNLENESRMPPGFLDLESMIFEATK